jgi:hypothetical protein
VPKMCQLSTQLSSVSGSYLAHIVLFWDFGNSYVLLC